ncbi:endo-1,4-beta-xylanase [Obba rivulosa]|uniref:Beta-xylanase n=1 Tax=Obba rivulosa TaxID=1052685 RepID=A0A8E2AME9_9APHY|nr:endo-1,4-beta-xylanase [Obba rivulosa]
MSAVVGQDHTPAMATIFARLASLALLLPFCFASPAASSSASLPGSTARVAGLNAVGKAAGKLYFGTATNANEFQDDAVYGAIINNTRQFGQITPANAMKWEYTEPNPGNFTFEDGDVIRDLARNNGQLLRGHNCVWYQQLPDWITNGTFTYHEMIDIVENHCGTLVGHYKGEVYAWDVINESLNDDGTFRENVFYNATGSDYIPAALRAARAADPHAKLYINDYGIEGTGNKSTALQNLVRELKSEGVPIDGVGIQCHLTVGQLPTGLLENFHDFGQLGVEFAVTELDMAIQGNVTADALEQQKQDYATVVSACLSVPACVGVTVWDFTDKYGWITNGHADIWDDNLQKKPAFDGVVLGFESH